MPDVPDELSGLTPEEVLTFLREAGDDELRERVHAIGTAVVLDLVFTGLAGRFPPKPGRSRDLLAFVLDDDGVEHRHVVAVDAAGGSVATSDEPARATLSTTLVRFLRVAAGAVDPKRLVLSGRMTIGGDAIWLVRVLGGLRG